MVRYYRVNGECNEGATINIFDGMTIDLEAELATIKNYRELDYIKSEPSEYIRYRKHKLGITNKQIASKLGISESLVSKMLKGERMTRDNLLKLGFVLNLKLEEVNQLMKYYSYSTLYVKDKRDQIILHAILHNHSIDKVNHNLKKKQIEQLL